MLAIGDKGLGSIYFLTRGDELKIIANLVPYRPQVTALV